MSETQNKIGLFCWNELMTTDVEAVKGFYEGMFGWTTKTMEGGGDMPYHFFQKGEEPVGGLMGITPEMGPVPPHWASYVMVEDIDASVAKVESLGGKVLQPVLTVGEMGKLAVLQDPSGATVSLWQALQNEC